MSTYLRDEFDAVPESPRRQGVHRTRSTEPRRGLGWIIAAGIAALIIGAAAFFLMPRLADTSSMAGVPLPSSAAPSGAPTPSSTGTSASPSASPTEASPSPSAAGTATAASSGGANRALEVGVYNSTGTAGLASRVGDQARAAGWAVTSVGNWSGGPVNTSIVFYRSAGDAASAQALAADLGIPTVLEAPGLGIPLAAVIGPGYAG
ncbi:LytR C-terminal domain-containing protein [Sinomonas mesophila]|uniref:LytR C-terminal domain-containing protein n=1 Tax=Sinomonas mesophila TaxID=1531955 RepID=UPI000987904C|nr:LytR C-terminal domain-containing protein [Sinomonas mesophila]